MDLKVTITKINIDENPETPGKYGEAHYIAVSPRDEVFVADTLNWRVQKYVRQ